MRKTRNLFLICGARDRVVFVLEKLTFKGLVTMPMGSTVSVALLKEVFSKNKSVACYAGDFVDMFTDEAKEFEKDKYVLYVSGNKPYGYGGIIHLDSEEPIEKQFERIVLEYGCNIGDHKSNISSGGNDGPTAADCAYCRYLNGDTGGNNRMIYKSESFFVLATVGQFVTGYLLIIPKKHIMSNAELSPEEVKEFKDVLDDIEYILRLTYGCGMILVWENGSGRSGKAKAKDSVVHSHVHVVASELTAEEVEEKSKLGFKDITLEELFKYADVSYLLIRSEKDHSIWKICPSDDVFIPRQWIRNEVAEKMGINDETWNWRLYPFEENMELTVEQIKEALLKNWKTVPERVKRNVRCLVEDG